MQHRRKPNLIPKENTMKLIDLIDQKKDLMASQENLIATCHASGRETLNAGRPD
jgi:hypothetical protein